MRNQILIAVCAGSLAIAADGTAASTAKPKLWNEPADIASRDLIYGIGGKDNAPVPPFTFVQEDMHASSPKFVVRDANGTRWKVKLGSEAAPETVTTRFVWAAGYYTDQDYLLPVSTVSGMPKLKRGAEFVSADGVVHNGRYERSGHHKTGNWNWAKNPYAGTRELNGLRVLMAMFNNYDMKDAQNAIYQTKDGRVMLVADLGATLGPTASRWPLATPRGVPDLFGQTKFITKVNKDTVDFAAASWPKTLGVIPAPPLPYTTLTQPMRLFGHEPFPNVIMQRSITRGIPRADARWMGDLLSKLTPQQIRDGFRAGGYDEPTTEAFARELEKLIAALKAL